MSDRNPRRRVPGPRQGGARLYLAVVVALVGVAVLGLYLIRPAPSAVAWAHFGTADVHSLAFVPGSLDHLYFGHHNGILETTDGGKSWRPLAAKSDAMAMRAAADGSIIIAGHDVFQASQDDGATWTDIASDLPNIDIHGFARDPGDPDRMWAYLATGGIYESDDRGSHWQQVYPGHVPFLFAVRTTAGGALIGIDPGNGVVTSPDGGRTWSLDGDPPDAPVYSLAATTDGRIVVLGGPHGLFRSDDAGHSWRPTALTAPPFAIAVSDDGTSVAAVSRANDFYRSSDGGLSWPGP